MGVGKQLGLFEALKNGNKQDSEFEESFSEIEGFICNNSKQLNSSRVIKTYCFTGLKPRNRITKQQKSHSDDIF